MKNLFHKYSKQELVESLLNYELNLSKNKRSEKIIHIIDLLAYGYNNKQFIKELYRNILEREPDSEGYNLYLNLLRAGKTKEYLLYSFIKSPEAQKINIEIRGLEKLTHPNLFFQVSLFLKKIYYFLFYRH